MDTNQLVQALIDQGYVHPHDAIAVTNLIASQRETTRYAFKSDLEFLHASIEHHTDVYFNQFLEVQAASHHNGQRHTGRLLKDQEIENAAVELTTLVINELGQSYRRHLDRYFGGDPGLTSYILSRISAILISAARTFNEIYLDTLSRRIESDRRTHVVTNEINSNGKPTQPH